MVIFNKGRTRKLMYTKRAQQFISRNPGLLGQFTQARRAIAYKPNGTRITIGETIVEKIKSVPGKIYFSVERGGKKLFVKEASTLVPSEAKSIAQTEAMQKARPTLRKHGIEPMKYEFAIESRGRSFLVAEFQDLRRVEEIEKQDHELYAGLEARIEAASAELQKIGISEFTTDNCFYDPTRRRLIAFDLIKK